MNQIQCHSAEGLTRSRLRTLFLILGLMLAVSVQAAPAGRVLFASGNAALIDSAGNRRPVHTGDQISSGDTLVTDLGRIQVRFSDGGLVAVHAHSRFRIDEYRYDGKPDGRGKSFFSLLKGGFRAITGAIGKVTRSAYRVNAVVATIGIRGTAYNVELCQLDCVERNDGLYLDTSQGVVVLKNKAGELEVPAGAAAYVKDANTAPKLTRAPRTRSSQSPVPQGLNEPSYQAGEHFEPGQSQQQAPVPPPTPSPQPGPGMY